MSVKLTVSHQAIRNQRLLQGLSVAELAERSGVTASALYRIENGERSSGCRMSTLRRVAAGLGVDVSALLVDEKDLVAEGAA